eukprot:scaffold22663_cov111-Cylindrotheca_fusiformis.AAC.1
MGKPKNQIRATESPASPAAMEPMVPKTTNRMAPISEPCLEIISLVSNDDNDHGDVDKEFVSSDVVVLILLAVVGAEYLWDKAFLSFKLVLTSPEIQFFAKKVKSMETAFPTRKEPGCVPPGLLIRAEPAIAY